MVGPSDRLKVWVRGAIVTLVTVFWATVTGVDAMTPPLWALMLAVPSATAVSRPLLFIVATVVRLELQVTCEVTSPVLLLPKVAVAEYCWVTPG